MSIAQTKNITVLVCSPLSTYIYEDYEFCLSVLYSILYYKCVMEFVNSEKSKPIILYEGYKFRFHKTLNDDVRLCMVIAVLKVVSTF